MQVSRLDLDGRGAGSPEGLVALILKAEPDLPVPVPIEDLCTALDITAISALEADKFDGVLLTDIERSSGIVFVSRRLDARRRRFTIAHELGHFLIPTHIPNAEGMFQCSREDLGRISAREGDRRLQMEVEANRFASLILIPPARLRFELNACRDPDVGDVRMLARLFNVSKEAMARAYALHHAEVVAIVMVRDGKVLRSYRDIRMCPYLDVRNGNPIPAGSSYHSTTPVPGKTTDKTQCDPQLWFTPAREQRILEVTEQILFQRDGFAMLLLHAMLADEEDDLEEDEIQRRWHVGFRR